MPASLWGQVSETLPCPHRLARGSGGGGDSDAKTLASDCPDSYPSPATKQLYILGKSVTSLNLGVLIHKMGMIGVW